MTQLLQIIVKLMFEMQNIIYGNLKDLHSETIRPATTILFKSFTNNPSILRLNNVKLVNKKVLKLLLWGDANNFV